MTKICLKTVILITAALGLLSPGAWSASICDSTAGNLVHNCGFESGSFSSWSVTGNLYGGINGFYVGVDNTNPNSGTYEGYFGAPSEFGQTGSGNEYGPVTTLSQDIAGALPYHLYSISFYLDSNGCSVSDPGCPGYHNYFDVMFAGQTLDQVFDDTYSGVYTLETFTGGSSNLIPILQFDFTNDDDYFFLDDVVVRNLGPGGPTPEPATLLLVAPVVAALLLVRRRRAA